MAYYLTFTLARKLRLSPSLSHRLAKLLAQ